MPSAASGARHSSAFTEREVKVAAGPGMILPDLDGVLPGVTASVVPPQRLMATYYDTTDLRLARSGVTLRHRLGGGGEAWTVKLPDAASRPEGGLARREIGFSGRQGRVPETALDLVRGLVRSAPVVAVARLRTDRSRVELRRGDGRLLAEVDDDDVSVLAGGLRGARRRPTSRFRELEVELADGADPAVLGAVVERLRAAGAGGPDPTPKVARALGSRASEPPDVAAWTPGHDASAGEAMRAAIAAGVARLIGHDAGVRLGDDAEDVHQARVATRRLRSDLRLFRSLLDEGSAGAVRAELGWLAHLLGDVRDTDVLLERLRSQAASLCAVDAEPAAALLGRLAQRREAVRRALLAGMASPRYTALLDRLVEAASAAAPIPARPQSAAAGEETEVDGIGDDRARLACVPAAEFLPGLVARPWHHLAAAVADLGLHPTDDAFHNVRIRAKRCRYAAEAASPVVGKRAERLAAAVAGVQGILGDLHDAVVSQDWLRQAAGQASTAEALAAGQLIAGERRKARAGRAAWPKAWKKASAKGLRSWLEDG